MAQVIRMPLLSDTMTEGKIIAWNKKVGDKVKSDDVLAEVETDKATMEVVGYEEGTLLYIGVEAGNAAKVNQVIAVVGEEGEDFKSLLENEGGAGSKEETKEDTKPEAGKESPAPEVSKKEEQKEEIEPSGNDENNAQAEPSNVSLPEGAREIRMPLLSDTMQEGKIVAWNKKVGDSVKSDDVLAEVETDKATMEVVGYEEGTLLYIGVEAGKAAKVNELIAIIGTEGTDVSAYAESQKSGGAATTAKSVAKEAETGNAETETNAVSKSSNDDIDAAEKQDSDGRIKASPLAKKLAAEKGVDISKIQGTGDGGRIVKNDVDNYKPAAESKTVEKPAAAASAAPEVAKPEAAKSAAPKAEAKAQQFVAAGQEGYTDVPLTQMRKVIARRLSESKFGSPHFYLTMEINMDNAIAARGQMNETSPVKISFNDLVIKAAAMALRKHPDVNSSFMGDFIRQNQHIHIGSALALPEGLIVPVIRFADQKTLSQIAEDAKTLYQKAKDKKIQPNEFSGNTFTISNLGMMDIEEFTAIINPPDSCILAVGRIKEVVVPRENTDFGFGVANIMKVTLSCDHRSVDGAVGAAFLQTLKGYLENPVTMLV